MTIGRKLAAGFAAVVAVLCGIGLASVVVLRGGSHAMTRISSNYIPEMTLASAFEREILNARIHFIYHVTIQKPGSLAKGWERFGKAQKLLPELQAMAASAPEMAPMVGPTNQLGADLRTYEEDLRQILKKVELGEDKSEDFAPVIARWAMLGGRLVDTAAKLNSSAAAEAGRESTGRAAGSRKAVEGITLACLLGLLIATVLSVVITRSISGALSRAAHRMTEAAKQLTLSSKDLASASETLAAGATEQSASIEETSAACQEIDSMAGRSSASAAAMANKMAETERSHARGGQALEQMIKSMEQLRQSNVAVSKIIGVIDEIAFQTNILALNAAVEAARAGEAGLGFAVVADEVRTLAQRSAEAARQTSELIGSSASTASASHEHVEHVAEVIRVVAQGAQEARRLAEEVDRGSREQREGIQQIAKAISHIEVATQGATASSERAAEAAGEIAGQAESMQSVAAELEAMVG